MNSKERIYSEVYSIINLMDDKYKKRLPLKLYELIDKERVITYNPVFDPKISLIEQNISREAIAMLVLLQLNYWCDTDEEKEEINKMLKENTTKVQQKMREMYSSENIFKNLNEAREKLKEKENIANNNLNNEENTKIDEKEKGLLKNVLKKIGDTLRK